LRQQIYRGDQQFAAAMQNRLDVGANLSELPPSPLYRPDFRIQNGMLEVTREQSGTADVEYMGVGAATASAPATTNAARSGWATIPPRL
jgi:hypothetical protein